MNPTRVLGISCWYHDSAACLIQDGQVVAAVAEERLSRVKHDNRFPKMAIEWCLHQQGIAINELDAIVFYEKPIIKLDRVFNQHISAWPRSFKTFTQTFGVWFTERLDLERVLKNEFSYFGPIHFVPHHMSHAASSYYLSGWNDAVIVTLDGVGEWATTTIGLGHGQEIKIDQEIRFPHSLGLLYSAITTFLGFEANDAEYKVMGLAAYGNPNTFKKQFEQLVTLNQDGSYNLNLEYFDFTHTQRMYTDSLIELLKCSPRNPESVMKKKYQDIAAALQQRLEEVVFHILNHSYQKYGKKRLCLAGGVALNSVMNGKILKNTPFTEFFIPPDPGDAGGAMGAALWLDRKHSNKNTSSTFTPYLGPSFEWFEIEKILKRRGMKYKLVLDRAILLKKVATSLKQKKIIGWYQGAVEWGPRALGNRSILSAANPEKMRDIINEKVKHRELFRPFAPVILEDKIQDYFEVDEKLSKSARYMLLVYPFKPKIGQKNVPAVVHVDGTGRLQTLARLDNPLYYDLIALYNKMTGVPILINTSFNVRGEPIVCTPENALDCFLKTDIDYLVMDQFIVYK